MRGGLRLRAGAAGTIAVLLAGCGGSGDIDLAKTRQAWNTIVQDAARSLTTAGVAAQSPGVADYQARFTSVRSIIVIFDAGMTPIRFPNSMRSDVNDLIRADRQLIDGLTIPQTLTRGAGVPCVQTYIPSYGPARDSNGLSLLPPPPLPGPLNCTARNQAQLALNLEWDMFISKVSEAWSTWIASVEIVNRDLAQSS